MKTLSVFAALLFVVFSAPVLAQLTAQLTGTVLDASGAAITGASVRLVNVDTNFTWDATSNTSGSFAFPVLQPGEYRLTVEASGFRTTTRSNIRLEVAQTARVDFSLEVGGSTQSVDVVAEAELLDSGISSIGQVVGSNSVSNLPTNGRNSYGFITLVPGVRAPGGFQLPQIDNVSSAFVSINGARPNQNTFYIDGGNNTQSNFNGPTYYPSIDTVQEFKVQTNNFSAEYANTAGGVVNLVTKSGSNKIHGSLYEFLRHDKLDATPFFLNKAGLTKPRFRFNQFGGTAGGPIQKNRMFFFGGYEGLRMVQGVTYTTTVPTDAQRAGDFSTTLNQAGQVITVYDPTTTVPDRATAGRFVRTPFPGNRIPQSSIDPVSRNLLPYIPLPNTSGDPITGNNNYISNSSAPTSKDDYSGRIDYQVTDKTFIYGRVSFNHTLVNTPQIWGADNPASPQIGITEFWRWATVVNANHIFSPAVVLELSSAFNRWAQQRIGPGVGFDPTQLGFPSSLVEHSAIPAFPSVTIAGMQGSASQGNVYGAGILAGGGAQKAKNGFDRFEQRANLTWMRGNHSLRFGGLFGVPRQGVFAPNGYGGSYNFTAAFTQGPDPQRASATAGIGFASFLLGTAANGSHPTSQVGMNVISKGIGGYIQDDWKITPKLTLNFGVRYDYTTPFTERYDHLSNFDTDVITQVDGQTLRGGLSFVNVDGNPRGMWEPDRNNIAPRFGFAYNLGSATVFRGGYGVFFAQMSGGGFNNNAVPNTGFNCSTIMTTSIDGGLTPYTTLSDPFPNGYCVAPGNTAGALTNLGQATFIADRNNGTPYSQQWSIDIQRSLPWNLVVDVGYAGNHGAKLLGVLEWNQVDSAYQPLGNQLQTPVPNPYSGIVSSGPLAAATVPRNQLLRPYPQFMNVTSTSSAYGNSIYHAFQSKLEKRFAKGLSFLAAYTWSKIIDDVPATTVAFPGGTFAGGALQDFNNRRNERALAAFDTTHNFAFSYLWDLPFGTGKPYLSHGIAGYILGNWQLNGIINLQSGTPLQIVGGNANGLLAGTARPNWSGQNASLNGPISERLTAYFDTSQFSLNEPFTFGNSPRLMPNLRAPGLKNWTASVFKVFPIGESIRLQFRTELFNVFNSTQFGFPNSNINATDFGVISTQVNQPRDIQFALRLVF